MNKSSITSYAIEYLADYHPYGQLLRSWQSTSTREKYLSTQHQRDISSGLDYRNARFSDPETGIFYGVDPLASKFPAWSPYAYTLGNPVNLIDPSGMGPEGYTILVDGEDVTSTESSFWKKEIDIFAEVKTLEYFTSKLVTLIATQARRDAIDRLNDPKFSRYSAVLDQLTKEQNMLYERNEEALKYIGDGQSYEWFDVTVNFYGKTFQIDRLTINAVAVGITQHFRFLNLPIKAGAAGLNQPLGTNVNDNVVYIRGDVYKGKDIAINSYTYRMNDQKPFYLGYMVFKNDSGLQQYNRILFQTMSAYIDRAINNSISGLQAAEKARRLLLFGY